MMRTMKIIMTLSVVLNILFIGTIGSYAYKTMQHKPQWRERIQDKLSPEGQNYMARTFQEIKAEMKNDFQDFRRLQQDMISLMEAEEFDDKAYDKLANEIAEKHMAMMAAKIKTHKQMAQDLSAEDRKLLARRLAHMGASKPKQGRNKQDRQWGPKANVSP